MGAVELRIAVAGGVCGNQRQIAGIGQIDQRGFSSLLGRIIAPGDLDVEPIREQRLKCIAIGPRRILPRFGQQPHQRALARASQADQPLAAPFKIGQSDVRFQLQWPSEVRSADQMAQVVPAGIVLGIERQPVNRPAGIAQHPQQRPDDRLDPRLTRCPGKGHCRIEPVTVRNRDRRKGPLLRQLGNRFGINRPFEHRIARQHTQRDEGFKGHGPTLGRAAQIRKSRSGIFSTGPRQFGEFRLGKLAVMWFPSRILREGDRI